MKTMTCNQLAGACDMKFSADTFEEISEMSKNHGMEMFKAKDEAHLQAMQRMKGQMLNPGDYEKWFNAKKEQFSELAED